MSEILILWASVLALWGIYDASMYSRLDVDKKPQKGILHWLNNPHLLASVFRIGLAAFLLKGMDATGWVEHDVVTWVQYMLGLLMMLPLIHTGFYLQIRRWFDNPGPNYWFFGDTHYKGQWIAGWVPDPIKLFMVFAFEPFWYIRIGIAVFGYFIFMEPGW